MRATLTIAHLTWLEARRRRIVFAAVICGTLFLIVYGVAIFAIDASIRAEGVVNAVLYRAQSQFFMQAGLYVVNFLTIAVAIMLAVDTLSGEISSGVMQTLASKPIGRAEILLGKWLTYWLMTAAYLLFMGGGVVLVGRAITGFGLPGLPDALPLILLGATVLLTVTMAGGVRFTTITNGMVAFAFYGISFIGGWIELVGGLVRNETALRIGTIISLLSPADAMWRRAAYETSSPAAREVGFNTPFVSPTVPSAAMIVWTIGFVVATLVLAIRMFQRRAL